MSQSHPEAAPVPSRVRELIRARLMARQVRDRQQKELLSKTDLWHSTIATKLESLKIPQFREIHSEPDAFGETTVVEYRRQNAWLDNFLACGTQTIVRVCECCGDRAEHQTNCSQKFCPRCQWKLTKARTDLITKWATRLPSALHIVLTQKNFTVLTRAKLRAHVVNLGKIRRQKVFKSVAGGCVSVEITNEGNGWHLHSHWLVSSRFVPASELAIAWGKLVGQEFAIVRVKPLTSRDYIGEVAKYVVEGCELAKWEPEQIWEFCSAIRGRRFFFTFGELSKLGPEIRRELAREKPERQPCDCGSLRFKFVPTNFTP